jgi:hypothetical protein
MNASATAPALAAAAAAFGCTASHGVATEPRAATGSARASLEQTATPGCGSTPAANNPACATALTGEAAGLLDPQRENAPAMPGWSVLNIRA